MGSQTIAMEMRDPKATIGVHERLSSINDSHLNSKDYIAALGCIEEEDEKPPECTFQPCCTKSHRSFKNLAGDFNDFLPMNQPENPMSVHLRLYREARDIQNMRESGDLAEMDED